ncbi:MAG: aminotransferase class V-fold PLP-dependent enzyme [Acidimicrobiales bacterium]|jgi:selenocysteine lyase/cysteine desulfurase
MDIADFRAQFPVLEKRAYLYSGSLAPAAASVRQQWDLWSNAWSYDPRSVMTLEAKLGRMSSLREAFAALIGADSSEIALVDNTSRAANIAVRILENRGRGNVVVDDSTYPSSVYPWRAHGRDVRYVPTDGIVDATEAVAQAIDDETIAVCVSHVSPFSGRKHDLAAIGSAAHTHGALLMVDAAQTAGVLPINVRVEGIDLLVTTSMKWLLGPPGIGYLYVGRTVLSNAPVLDVGYIGLDCPHGEWPVRTLPPISPDAIRYELGLPSLPALAAARAGIELLLGVAVEQIEAHAAHLVTRCMDGLLDRGFDIVTPLDPKSRGAVIVFRCERKEDLVSTCRSHGVDIGLGTRFVRVDPHGFNNEEDIDRFLVCCSSLERGLLR